MAQGLLISHRTVSAHAHQATLETVRQVTDFDGQTVLVTNTYIELATGLNRRDARTGEWVRADDIIEAFEEGFLARQSAHQVLWPKRLDPAAVVEVQDAEGHRYRSRVLGLSWFDAASGESALIAGARTSEGELVATNTLLYPDAFDGVLADLVYVNRRDGMAQEVILREALPGPELWGLNPDSTRLEVITEFVEAPAFTKRERVSRPVALETERMAWVAPDLVDAEVSFGAYRLGPGRAFATGEEDDPGAGVDVAKRWEELEGRRVLFEQVEWRQVKDEIGRLPRQARAEGQDDRPPRTASMKRQLPARPVAVVMDFDRVSETPWKPDVAHSAEQAAIPVLTLEGSPGLAAFAPPASDLEGGVPRRPDQPRASDFGLQDSRAGYVLDYELVTSQADFTFKGDTTYYVSGTVILTGATTLEGGAVVKFAPMMVPILVRNTFACQTALYRPAIFTARDDDTVGAVITGSTGTVGSSYYGVYHLYFQTDSPVDVRHVRCKHAYYGLGFHGYYGNHAHVVRHAQLIDCLRPVMASGAMTLKVRNALIAEVKANGAAFYGNNYATVEGQHLTVANAPNLYQYQTPASFTLYNSLLVDVTVQDFTRRGQSDNVETTGVGTVFQTKGGGAYYLAASSPYRDLGEGSPDIEADLLSDLKAMTTEPPEKPVGAITGNTTWYRRSIRDINEPDLGYHYPALDYLVSGTAIQNVTLTLRNGVAVAGGDAGASTGFVLDPGGDLAGSSASLEPNRLVHAAAVQETSPGSVTLIAQNGGSGAARTVDLRSTQLVIPASSGSHFSGGAATSQLSLRDCELYGGQIPFNVAGVMARVVTLNNNVFVRVPYISLGTGADAGLTAHAYNNTFWRCSQINLNAAAGTSWQWHDNLFDTCVFWLYYGLPATSHNAYVGAWSAGSSWPLAGSSGGDVFLDELTYLTDAWGCGWYADTALLTAAGSRSATAAGLSDYTTGTHQNLEGDGTVSIGFHRRSEAPRRLAHWRFEGDAQSWLVSEEGIEPKADNGVEQVDSFTGGGKAPEIKDAGSPGDYLRYPEIEPGSYLPGLDLQRGSIRLWFKPNWTLSSFPSYAPLLQVGSSAGDSWALYFSDDSGSSQIELTSGSPAEPQLEASISSNDVPWATSPNWVRLGVAWDTPHPWRVNRAYAYDKNANGSALPSVGDGKGLELADLPSGAVAAEGFSLGGTPNGSSVADGLIDEVELFSYPIGEVEHKWWKNAWAAEAESDPASSDATITFGQPDEPKPDGHPLQWYFRREKGESNWTGPIAPRTNARLIVDDGRMVLPPQTNVVYEYGRITDLALGTPSSAEITAAAALEPVHQRGHVILVVEKTFLPEDWNENDLTPEIEQLRKDLVGDGWTVSLISDAERHIDQSILDNDTYDREFRGEDPDDNNWVHRDALADEIYAARDLNAAQNVVFILGHVTVPYAGIGGWDGHYSMLPSCEPFGLTYDHGGPWVADGFYGIQRSTWRDDLSPTVYASDCDKRWGSTGDGFIDTLVGPVGSGNEYLPAPEMAVGRVDFARLGVFEDADFLPGGLSGIALERELLRLYLAKDHRYRMGQLPFGKRMCFQDLINGINHVPEAIEFGSALFGLDYGSVFDGNERERGN